MKTNILPDFINGHLYESIEEGMYTVCPLCGTPLDWKVSLVYRSDLEANVLTATASSCGLTFHLIPEFYESVYQPIGYYGYIKQGPKMAGY